MDYPGVVLGREASHYMPAWLALAAQLGAIVRRARARARPIAAARPPSDATWFVPVYLCALSSIYHAYWSLFGLSHCWGLPTFVYAEHAQFAAAALALTTLLCFLGEHLARIVGLPVRAPQATLPGAVVAALLGAGGSWLVLLLAIIPLG